MNYPVFEQDRGNFYPVFNKFYQTSKSIAVLRCLAKFLNILLEFLNKITNKTTEGIWGNPRDVAVF